MPIGYVTENQGESRYTVAIPRKTPLLESLIEARRTELDGIANALQALESQESAQRAAYDAAMAAVNAAIAGYNECRESYTELQCRNAKTAEANDAYSAAMSACFDEWNDCLFACDIGDRDCQDACDDARDKCEATAKRVRDNALAAVNRLCADAVVEHLQQCQETWAPIVAAAQAAATDLTNDLQNTLIAIQWEKSKQLSATKRLNELLAIESSAESVTAWSAQYNTAIPTGELPEDPTGTEENAVIVAAVSGRAVITEIASVEPCLHDSRALPSGVLFVDSALAPGTETWRPTWRTGTVTAIYDPADPGDWPDPEKPLRVSIDPALMYGTLGTRVSRNPINCTPPGAFFDEDGELDARLGIARQAYDDALADLADVRAEIQACKDGYTVQGCTAPRVAVCEYNREQSMIACIDNRDYCLSIAQDSNGEQYCLDQFDACEQQVDAIFSACVDGATADCIEAKRSHDEQCDSQHAAALAKAETEASNAQRDLINATADIQGPPAELILDVAVEHCFTSVYEVGDDVLIDFPTRAPSTGVDWASASSEQIRVAAMAVWQSAQVVGWASNTRPCVIDFVINSGGFGINCKGDEHDPWRYIGDRYWWGPNKTTLITWEGRAIWINGASPISAVHGSVLCAGMRDGMLTWAEKTTTGTLLSLHINEDDEIVTTEIPALPNGATPSFYFMSESGTRFAAVKTGVYGWVRDISSDGGSWADIEVQDPDEDDLKEYVYTVNEGAPDSPLKCHLSRPLMLGARYSGDVCSSIPASYNWHYEYLYRQGERATVIWRLSIITPWNTFRLAESVFGPGEESNYQSLLAISLNNPPSIVVYGSISDYDWLFEDDDGNPMGTYEESLDGHLQVHSDTGITTLSDDVTYIPESEWFAHGNYLTLGLRANVYKGRFIETDEDRLWMIRDFFSVAVSDITVRPCHIVSSKTCTLIQTKGYGESGNVNAQYIKIKDTLIEIDRDIASVIPGGA